MSRYKFDRSREFIPGYKFGGRHWRSVAPCPAEAKRKRGYNLSRSQEFVKVQDFNCEQRRVSRCNNHYKFILRVGAKAKSVTNNLPILSVLCAALYFVMSMNLCPTVFHLFRLELKWNSLSLNHLAPDDTLVVRVIFLTSISSGKKSTESVKNWSR